MTHTWTVLAALILAALPGSAGAAGSGGSSDGAFRALPFDAALAAAGAEKRPLLVSVGADWCSACKELEMKSLSRGAVRQFLRERFVAIRIDGEKGEGPALVKRYHVVGFPTVLVLDAKGKEIDRVFDVLDEAAFVNVLRGFIEGSGTLDDLLKKDKPGDLAGSFEIGSRLAIRGERDRAVLRLCDVVNADIRNEKGFTTKALLIMGKYLYLRGQNDAQWGKQMLEWLVGYFPDSAEAKEGLPSLAIAYARLGDEAKAMRIFDALIRRKPGAGHNTLAWFYFREKKDASKALATASLGLAQAPSDHALWDSAAEFAHALGRKDDAAAAAKRAADLDPKDAYYQYQLARFARLAGKTVPSVP